MEYYTGAFIIVIMCAAVLCIVSLRKRAEFILNFMLRTIVGTVSIFFINQLLIIQNLSCTVGINLWTALTSGMLGIPGVALLYGINFYKLL